MITLDTKSKKTASSSLLGLLRKNDKNKTQFPDLLKSIDTSTAQKEVNKGDLKNIKTSQNMQQIIQSLKNDLKDETALENEALELNEHLGATFNNKELKELIYDAKNYLKQKILSSDGYKEAQIKELPNTLEGLIKVAKILDIDVSKITLQDVQEFDAKDKKSIHSLISEDMSKKVIQEHNKALDDSIETPDKAQNFKSDTGLIENMPHKEAIKEQKEVELKDLLIPKEQKNDQVEQKQTLNIKELPIFKAQDTTEYTTTQHIMQSKLNSEQKPLSTQKDRADEVLRTLLQASKSSNINEGVNLGVEFSVDSAKVIAAKPKNEDTTLSDLLQGGSKKDDALVSQDMSIVKGNNELDVKINEAKQMIKYLSNDIKNAIDEYKSPFTRVKVQLNPQNLGEVDLTVVQRGNNLHINLSSNNAAINTLSMNLNDLKIQLNNNGINNATFNFSSNSQDAQGSYSNQQQQQQSGQNQQRAAAEYSYFEKDEQNEEILSSLEIVVPRYI